MKGANLTDDTLNEVLEGAVLTYGEERVDNPPWQLVEQVKGAGTRFWLDVTGADEPDVQHLTDLFNLHPEVLTDTTTFGQRARVAEYEGYVMVVVYGAEADLTSDLVELHTYVLPHGVLTVRQVKFGPLDEVHLVPPVRLTGGSTTVPALLTRILSTMVATFADALEVVDKELEEIEQDILERPDKSQMERLVRQVRPRMSEMRRAVEPIRALVGISRFVVSDTLPEMDDDMRRHLRDLATDLAYVGDQLEAERDRLAAVMDVYMNEVNNRQNAIMKQVAVVSTIFLPLTFITGYFGQNFAWMTDELIPTRVSWLLLGVLLYLGVVTMTVALIRHRRWFND
jgi:magnesium transporter